MAFGFPPKFEQTVFEEKLDKGTMYIAALEAIQNLNWHIVFMRPAEIVAYSKVSFSSWGEEITIQFKENGFTIRSVCGGSQLHDLGKNKKNIAAFLNYFDLQKAYYTTEIVAEKWSQLAFDQESKSEEEGNAERTSKGHRPLLNGAGKSKLNSFQAIFLPREGYFVTPILLYANVIVFILMLIAGVDIMLPDGQQLIQWGGNFRPSTLDAGLWRLITACFVHIGIIHLLFNMYALLFVGVLLEPYLGTKKFIAAYLITGVAASIASVCWHEYTVSAGASGAIFGLYGVFLALLLTNLLDSTSKKAMLTSIMVFVGYNILNGLKPNSGIDNAGHIGGLLSGMLVGFMFLPSVRIALKRERSCAADNDSDAEASYTSDINSNTDDPKNDRKGNLAIISLVALLIISGVTAFSFISSDSGEFKKNMDRFAYLESMALKVYTLPTDTPEERVLDEIKESGIKNWKECRVVLQQTQQLRLPEPLSARVKVLLKYVNLREKMYDLLYLSIANETDEYDDQMDQYGKEIETIINQLKAEAGGG